MDFSPLTHLPLPRLIPGSLLSSWNWEKSSPVPDTEHQLQAPFLLRFPPCLFSAVSVGSIFTKIIHWIEERDLIAIILFVLFKTGKEMERKGLHCYQCYWVLNVGVFFSPVLIYPSTVIFVYHCSKIAVFLVLITASKHPADGGDKFLRRERTLPLKSGKLRNGGMLKIWQCVGDRARNKSPQAWPFVKLLGFFRGDDSYSSAGVVFHVKSAHPNSSRMFPWSCWRFFAG